ncbi:MAG: hypothetical protein H0W83_06800, partial [Planctomycetes bacterium]|nr:hypothetical protein [Planctomycetota bacterium]
MPSSSNPHPPMAELWVDPVSGLDDADGGTRATALRTIAAAWQRIPRDGADTDHGWRIWLCAGVHAADVRGFATLNDRRGSESAPIEIIAADPPLDVRVPPIDANDCSHLNLIGLTIASESLAGV